MNAVRPSGPPTDAVRSRAGRTTVLVAAALATGLLAGVFGDWAHTVMPGLAATDDRTFLTAFQALDRAIVNPPFLLAFVAAPFLSGAVALLSRGPGPERAVFRWAGAAAGLLMAAVVITVVVHEPLNGIIRAAGDPAVITDPSAVRAAFDESRWAAWHVLRTVATTVALGCLARALVLHGRATASVDRAAAPQSADSHGHR